MATLSELRNYVHAQTDTLESDLPSATIDRYLQEAFTRTIAAETRWPFYETIWTATQAIGDSFFDMPTNCSELASVIDTANDRFRLRHIDYEEAEDQYFRVGNITGTASEYSIWGDVVYLWPQITFTAERSYALRGYRDPTDWIAGVPSVTTPDCDERLHFPLCHYAVALAYAQQEDEQLENVYMSRWQRDVEIIRSNIMDPRHHRPLTMGPQRYSRIGAGRYRPSFTIDVP